MSTMRTATAPRSASHNQIPLGRQGGRGPGGPSGPRRTSVTSVTVSPGNGSSGG
jgi:hypothetical protein